MGEPAKDQKNSFIEKLKEKQENQRALVQAIDDLAVEQKKLVFARIQFAVVILGFIGACWYSFDAIKPHISSLWTETWTPPKATNQLLEELTTVKSKKAKLGEDAVLPSPKQERVAASFVSPLPVTQSYDEFYTTFRPPPPEAAERLAAEFLGQSVSAPTAEDYNSLNQLPSEVVELDRMVQLDNGRTQR